MINSMTGYGDAQGQLNGVTYAVEIRVVNSRYFKTRIRLPDSVAFLEEDVERLLKGELSRGMVNCTLELRDVSANVLFDIDQTALQGVMERLDKLASSTDIKYTIDIGNLLLLPGMLKPVSPDAELAEQIREKILSITQQAIEKVKKMRSAEGAALAADLDSHCQAIERDLEQIRARSEVVPKEYTKRLKKRINELLADGKLKLDEATLAREVAILADRADISEEIARLYSHLEQFAQSCRANDQAGRRLDFIGQEMLREANTIASKAADTEIMHWVVDIKCWIDRIKEQVQNIE